MVAINTMHKDKCEKALVRHSRCRFTDSAAMYIGKATKATPPTTDQLFVTKQRTKYFAPTG